MNFLKKLFSRRDTGFFSPEDHTELMNPELQRAIEAVTQNNTSTTRHKLYEILLTTTFCLPSSAGSEEGTTGLSAVKNEEGEMALVAFSDPAALRRWEKNPESMIVLTADKLFALALENDFAEIQINPAGPAGGKLAHHEFARLAQGVIPE